MPTVERRRRDKINNWIVQLSKIIPDCNTDNSKTGAVSAPGATQKVCLDHWGEPVGRGQWAVLTLMLLPAPQSKGGILSKACDYIRELRQTNQRMQETFKEAERLQMDNELLRQQVSTRAGHWVEDQDPTVQGTIPGPLCPLMSTRLRS